MKSTLRMTPQTKIVLEVVAKNGHCSNLQILKSARIKLPNLSATTVHRITNRLINHGLIAEGPKINGVIMLDKNLTPHNHFVCSNCGGVKDIYLDNKLLKEVQSQTSAKILPSSMVIIGACQNCLKH